MIFNFGKGIEFGQRLFMFCVLAGLFVALLVLYVFSLIGEGLVIVGWTGLCGMAGAGVIMRGVQAAAREKAQIGIDKPIGIREVDDG